MNDELAVGFDVSLHYALFKMSVCLSVRHDLLHAGIVSKRLNCH